MNTLLEKIQHNQEEIISKLENMETLTDVNYHSLWGQTADNTNLLNQIIDLLQKK